MLATQHATSVLTINRLAAVILGLCLSACAVVVLAESAAPEPQKPAAASSGAKTVDPEHFFGVFTGTYENGVPVYPGGSANHRHCQSQGGVGQDCARTKARARDTDPRAGCVETS